MIRERREIVRLWKTCQRAVLATLVRVQGSSYRRVGARLLIADDGRYAGAISGGCLEAELIRKARWSVREGAAIQRFSTLFDDTADIPYGLGCGGTVEVLLEPSGTAEFTAILQAIESSLAGRTQHVRTWLPRNGTPLRRELRTAAEAQHAVQAVAAEDCIDEILLPPQRVVLCGAGDDARPLVSFCALMGWDTVVVDGRAQWARTERFPDATSVHVVDDPARFDVRPEDAVVLMTHSYEQDRAWLSRILPVGSRYLGLLGARHRSALLVSEAAHLLGWPVDRVCAQVFAPVGLHLGGDGSEAIALAIVAEIQAVCEGKLATSQRMTAESVAELITSRGVSNYFQAQCPL